MLSASHEGLREVCEPLSILRSEREVPSKSSGEKNQHKGEKFERF